MICFYFLFLSALPWIALKTVLSLLSEFVWETHIEMQLCCRTYLECVAIASKTALSLFARQS